MQSPPPQANTNDRLFVPLNTNPWNAFNNGEKTAELRGVNNQYNTTTVTEGRTTELRRGYSTNDTLWGEIQTVETSTDLEELVTDWFTHLQYNNRTLSETLASAHDLVGRYDEYIIFEVRLYSQ